ncbi:class I adenylate-forming enzyme family protein [Rhodococcus sp. NPDC058532]|uniref:class I adenylate-forming enzyme family protein n=1 Tax=Rhodococcus sp. NPDC058532 TaxID=3346540 RepID=UPI0036629999
MLSWNHIVEWRAGRHPDLLALADDLGGALTYAELAAAVEQRAGGWAAAGVGGDDVVAIVARNRVDWVVHLLALNRVGAVPAAVNWRLTAPELRTLFAELAPVAVLTDEEGLALVESAAPTLPRVVVGDRDFGGVAPARPVHRLRGESPFVLMHTSGTTGGAPKVISLTNQRLIASATYLKLVVPGAEEGARHLRAMPLFHLAGLANVTYGLFIGASVVIQSRFTAASFVDAVADHRIEFTNLVPSAIAMVVDEINAREQKPDLSSLVEIGYGASAISPEVLRAAIATLGCRFRQNYGCTETGGFPISTLDPADHHPESRHLRSAGKPALNWEVRIVGPDLEDLPVGEAGEIVVRGAEPFSGYWNNPDETAKALTPDGFWRIGDIGRLDEDGYLTIVDRAKDMVVSGGENVYPAEVEAVLRGHPDVAEVAVIGVPHPRWGEAVHAVIVERPGSRTRADQIVVWCRERLAGFKCPSSVEFVDEMPRNATGKMLKRVLRDKFWAGQERAVS